MYKQKTRYIMPTLRLIQTTKTKKVYTLFTIHTVEVSKINGDIKIFTDYLGRIEVTDPTQYNFLLGEFKRREKYCNNDKKSYEYN